MFMSVDKRQGIRKNQVVKYSVYFIVGREEMKDPIAKMRYRLMRHFIKLKQAKEYRGMYNSFQ
jgi:hypothetical protein